MSRKLALLAACCVLATGIASGVDFSYRSLQGGYPYSTVFASGLQRFARLKNNDNNLNTRYNPTAGAVGYLYSQEYWQAGASFSYEYGNRKYDFGDGSMKVRSSTPGIALFGTLLRPDGWYLEGSAYAGFNRLKGRDFNDNGVWHGDSNSKTRTQFAASLELGKSFIFDNNFVLTPHVGLDYAHSPGESYRFADGSIVGNNSSENFWEVPIGVGLSRTFLCGNWAITPFADATLVSSIGHMDNMNAYPGFSYRTAREWKTTGIAGDHWGGRFRTGVNTKLNDRTSIDVDYTFEGRSGYRDHRISAMLGWSF